MNDKEGQPTSSFEPELYEVDPMNAKIIGEPAIAYSDGATFHVSPTTISINFMRQEPWVGNDVQRSLVCIQISPSQFKVMAQTMPRVLEQYESTFGALPNPEVSVVSTPTPTSSDRES